MAYGTINADLMTTSDGVSSSGLYGFKNRIINGAMVINQRASGTLTLTSTGQYAVDQFASFRDTAGATCTIQQSSTVPNGGFTKSLLWTTTTGATAGVNDDACTRQFIEGFNFADLGFGTATAQSFTLSFWARSSITGTYGISLANSAANRCYMATYSISVANTWEQKTITVVGDTSGTWLTDNGIGLRIYWDMGSGTSRSIAASSAWGASYGTGLTGGVKISANTGATFYITGVQLEKGSTATSFDYRSYGTELGLCQRYYETGGFDYGTLFSGNVTSGNNYFNVAYLKVTKRAACTVTTTNLYANNFPATASSVGGSNPTVSIQLYRSANGTGVGNYNDSWTASAEL